MRLTTKRNWRYFLREFFSYLIPIILIAGSIDVFYHFMQCTLHPEWSAPCSVNWILAIIYGISLIIIIILEIISTTMLRKVKKQIEKEFFESTLHTEKTSEETKKSIPEKTKKFIAKSDKKGSTTKVTKKEDNKKIKTSTKKKTTKK